MKINQKNLELKFLKCVTSYDDAIYLAGEKSVQEYHFLTKEPGTDVSLTGKLYSLCQEYAQISGGYKVTENVLESLLIKKGLKQPTQEKFLKLWYEVSETEVSIDDFPMLALLLKERHSARLMAEMVDKIANQVGNDQVKDAVSTMIDYVNVINEELDDFKKEKVTFDMSNASEFFFEEYDKRLENPDLFKGINCGLSHIDSKTFGWMPGQLIVLLAPSGGGKSVQLLNWGNYAHSVCKKNIIYFSFEMSAWLCQLRHAALISKVNYGKIKSQTINSEEKSRLQFAFDQLKSGPYFEYLVSIEDPTPEYVEQKIREITNEKGKPDLVIVDYIGNMTTRSTSKNAKHWEKNGDASEGLFKLAKNYNLPIITAQQINRESIKENRKNKENGKAAAYYQDAASGDQRLIHLAHFVIGLEPNKEDNIAWYHSVKMRDAEFMPFASKWIPEYNLVEELTDSQQSALSMLKLADVNSSVSDFTPRQRTPETVDLDLSDWANDF